MADALTESKKDSIKTKEGLIPFKVVLPTDLLKDIQETEAKTCLDDDSPDGFFYIPNFISEAEEEHIINKIQTAPQPKWRSLHARSGEKIGRLQNWGGQVTKQALISEPLPDFLTTFPNLVERIRETGAFEGSKHGEPNHCLMNEYEPGQGILPHEDGSAYFSTVATVSLGGHTLLDIYRYASQDSEAKNRGDIIDSSAKAREPFPRFSILQERRSLLITRGTAYKYFLHGIDERKEDEEKHLASVTNGEMIVDPSIQTTIKRAKENQGRESNDPSSLQRQLRYSLTLRDVERVAPKNLMAMMMGK